MKKCIALVLILLGLVARTTSAQSVGMVITNGLMEPDGVAIGWNNNTYLTDISWSEMGRVLQYNQDNGVLTNFASGFVAPAGLVYVKARNSLFLGDTGLRQVFQLAPDGTISSIWGIMSTAGTADGTNSNTGGIAPEAGVPDGGNPAGKACFTGPAALAADPAGNVYVADIDSGTIRKISPLNDVSTVATGLDKPSGVAVDDAGRVYVADTMRHSIKMIDTDGTVKLVAGTGRSQDAGYHNGQATNSARFNKPRGLLWVGGKVGLLICDTDNHAVRQLYNGLVSTYATIGGDSTPYNLARTEDGNYVLTDLINSKLLSIQVTAIQPPVRSPVIGEVVYITNVFGSFITTISPVTNATFLNDAVVAIAGESGTSTFYVKGPNGEDLIDPSPTNGSSPAAYDLGQSTMPNSIVLPAQDGPIVTVKAIGTAPGRKASSIVTATFHFQVSTPAINGKNPGAFTIDTGATAGATFWYTVDGTDPVPYAKNARTYDTPTPSNPATILNIVNGTNDIDFRIVGYKTGYTPSRIVRQTFLFSDLQTSSIGVLQDVEAGSGATIVVPVQVKLASAAILRSLQFRVEITPENNAPDAILDQLRAMGVDPLNDFLPVKTPVFDLSKPATFAFSSYSNNVEGKPVMGLAISFIATNANFQVEDFATVAMLAIPVPPTANPGDSYRISVRYPSGTYDGQQLDVPLISLQDRHIIIQNIPYLVGDSAVAEGYNAGQFGSLKNFGTNVAALANNDVNNAFYASMGVRTPFSFSDVFDAMDAFPEDSSVAAGGDGQIRFLDWQIILNRALRLDTNNWMRSWAPGGRRVTVITNLIALADTPAYPIKLDRQGKVWNRQALIGATPLENVAPGAAVNVPVYITAQAEPYVAGLQWRATVEPLGGAPAIASPVQFVKASSLPDPMGIAGLQDTLPKNQTAVAWSLAQNQLPSALMKNYTLGHLVVTIPWNAQPGQQYRVRFLNADGAPDLKTQYDFETLSASIWVGTPAQQPQGNITDEWKQYFFGSLDNPWSAPEADPDGDGVINSDEYRQGTNPVKLRLQTAVSAVVLFQVSKPPTHTREQETDGVIEVLNPFIQLPKTVCLFLGQYFIHRPGDS